MTHERNDAFAPYEEDHRAFGATGRAFSSALRFKAMVILSGCGILLMATVAYAIY